MLLIWLGNTVGNTITFNKSTSSEATSVFLSVTCQTRHACRHLASTHAGELIFVSVSSRVDVDGVVSFKYRIDVDGISRDDALP
jgi:hypothetical protein